MIGGSGLLGQHLVEEAKARGFPVQATYAGGAIPGAIRMELADLEGTIRTLVRLRPKVVLLAAAMTDVDGCESHPEQAAVINANRAAYVRQVYSQDWLSPQHYHLILNTAWLGYERCSRLIADAATMTG